MNFVSFVPQLEDLKKAVENYKKANSSMKDTTQLVLTDTLETTCTVLCVGDEKYLREVKTSDLVAVLTEALESVTLLQTIIFTYRALALVGRIVPRGGVVMSKSADNLVPRFKKTLLDVELILSSDELCEEVLRCVCYSAVYCHAAFIAHDMLPTLISLEPLLGVYHLQELCLKSIISILESARVEDTTVVIEAASHLLSNAEEHLRFVFSSAQGGTQDSSSSSATALIDVKPVDVSLIQYYCDAFFQVIDRILNERKTMEKYSGFVELLFGYTCRVFENSLRVRKSRGELFMSSSPIFIHIYLTNPEFGMNLMMVHNIFPTICRSMLNFLNNPKDLLEESVEVPDVEEQQQQQQQQQQAVNDTEGDEATDDTRNRRGGEDIAQALTAAGESDSNRQASDNEAMGDTANAGGEETNADGAGAGSSQLLLSDDITTIPLMSDELGIAFLLEFLLVLFPPARAPFAHADSDNVTLPFHSWNWEDDFHNTGECAEHLSYRLDIQYMRDRFSGDFSPSYQVQHINAKKAIFVDFGSKLYQSGSGNFPRALRRSGFLSGFMHHRFHGLETDCTCKDGPIVQDDDVRSLHKDPGGDVSRDTGKTSSKGCCGPSNVAQKTRMRAAAGGFANPDTSSKSRFFTDPRIRLLLSDTTRKAFMSEEVVTCIISNCLPAFITILKNTVNPVVARHLSVLILRILSVTTEMCCGVGQTTLARKKSKNKSFRVSKKNKDVTKHIAERLNYQMSSLSSILTYLYVTRSNSRNEIMRFFSTTNPFNTYCEDAELRRLLESGGIIGKEYECFNYTIAGETCMASLDSILLLYTFAKFFPGPSPPLSLAQLEAVGKVTTERVNELDQFCTSQVVVLSTMLDTTKMVKKKKMRIAPASDCPHHFLAPTIWRQTHSVLQQLAGVLHDEQAKATLDVPLKDVSGNHSASLNNSTSSLNYVQPVHSMNPLSPAVVTSASLKKRISKSDPNVPAGLRSVLALYDELKQSGADFRVLTQRSPEMLNKVSGDMEEYLRPLLRRKMTTRLVEGPSSETGESVTKDITAATAKKLSYLQTELVRFVGEALGLSDMNQVFPPLVTEFSGRYTHRYNKNKSSGIIEELMWRPLVVSFTPFRDTQNAENQNTVYIVSEARREIMVMGKTCHYLPLKGLEESFFVTAFLTLGQLAFHLSGRASSFEFEDIPSTCSMQEVKQWNAWMEGRKCAFAADQILFFVDGVLVSNRLSTVLNVLFALAPSGDSLRECLNSFKETNDAIGDIFAREGADSTLVFMNALRSLNFFKQRHTIEFIVLEKFSYSALECQFPCGCVQKKCVPTVQEVLEEYNVQPYCGPTHLYTDIREDIDQRYPAFRLLQSLTLATQECGKDSGLYSPTVASSASFGSTDGERRFSSALIHDMYSQMTAFMFPPILSYVLSELQEKKTLDSHAVSFAVWNYPLIFPFEMRVTLLEMLISSKRRVSARIMKMVRSFSRKEIRQHFFGLHWLDGDRNKENPRIQLVVNRKKIGDSLGFLQLFSTCPFPIDVSFKEEKGIGPGPALEYYELVAKYLSSPSLGLFKTMEVTLPDGSVEVQTCPLLFPECKDPLFHSLEYEYLGCLLARLLILRRTTIVRFHPLFLAAIRGDNINDPSKLSENMLLLDPVIEKSLRQIEALSAADLAAMDLRFTIDVSGKEYGLKKDGANTVVTKENVKSYTDSVRKFHTSFSIRVAAHKVRLGLATLINLEYLSLFSIAELDVIFSGSQGKVWDTPAAFAKDVVTSHGYTRQSSVVVDFLDLIPSWDATLQRQFLKFLTGSSTLPISGRLSMPITIVRRDDAVTSAIRPSVPPPMEPRVSRPTSAVNSPARARARSHGHRRDTSGLDDGGEPQSARRSRSEARPPPEPEPLAAAAQKEVDRMLPTVSTCFNYFKLPCYSSKKILEKQLKTAILEGQGAFMLT